jgi:hypothetical protein
VRSIGTESPLDGVLSWFERIAYPSPDLTAVRPKPAAVVGAILVGVVFIGLEFRYGHSVVHHVLLAVVAVVALVSRLAKSRG